MREGRRERHHPSLRSSSSSSSSGYCHSSSIPPGPFVLMGQIGKLNFRHSHPVDPPIHPLTTHPSIHPALSGRPPPVRPILSGIAVVVLANSFIAVATFGPGRPFFFVRPCDYSSTNTHPIPSYHSSSFCSQFNSPKEDEHRRLFFTVLDGLLGHFGSGMLRLGTAHQRKSKCQQKEPTNQLWDKIEFSGQAGNYLGEETFLARLMEMGNDGESSTGN